MATAHKYATQSHIRPIYGHAPEPVSEIPGARIELVNVNDIQTPDYQRKLQDDKIKRMMREWDPSIVGFVHLSLRANGSLFAMDGQHRIETVRRLQGMIGPFIPAIVQEGLTSQEEALFFAKAQDPRNRSALKPEDTHGAKVLGGDQETVAIDRVVASCGFHIGEKRVTDGHGRIKAVTAVRDVYSRYGAHHLEETLSFIALTWGRDSAPEHCLILGVALFIAIYPDASLSTLGKTAGKTGAREFVRDAREHARRRRLSTTEGVAESLHHLYNKRNARKPLATFDDCLRDYQAGVRSAAARTARLAQGMAR